VEDCELWELEEVFTDRFKAFCKPHGNLPSGSVILVGSMSHLAKNGLNFYAPKLVETMTRLAGRVGPGINVIPLLPIPVGGIGSETLLRDMMDLDCWIVSTGAGQATGLPDSRDAFWRVVREEGMGGRRVYTSSAPLSLPGGIKNPRIRPFMSGAYAGTIPAEILPLEPEAERALVGSLLHELNEKFCVNLDPNPSLDRSIPPPPTAHNTGRTVFIGGSNLGRIAKAAAENGHMVVDLTVKGWIPRSGKIDKMCETLQKLKLTEIDTVVIDSMSNTAFLGTDEDGLPIPAEKSVADGRHHLTGDLQLAPPSAFKSTMKLVEKIISNTGGASILLTVPLPRYVTAACCDDITHVSNRQDPDFLREISGSEKSLSDAAAAGELTADAKILNMIEFFGPLESPLQELSTVDGTSIWAGDGVHLTSNATRVAATKLMKTINGGSEPQEPATKRARLESVIPVRASPSTATKAAPPAPPPAPKPVPPPLWLSGHLPANQRGSSNQRGQRGQPRGGRGGPLERVGQQTDGRGAAPRGAPRGGARGGRPGRWGRW
jgi:hypothetical protein